MTFQITLSRPPAAASFEVGSIAEAVAVLQQEESALVSLFKVADGLSGEGCEPEQGETPAAPGAPAATEAPKARRGRAPKEAVAPAPIPVPSAPPAAPAAPLPPVSLAIPADGGIPPAFVRDANNQAPAFATPTPPAPPPLLPNAPALAPPPTGVLAGKVVAELEKRAKGSPDHGKALADWLAVCGLTVPGMSYGDALAAVAFISDEKLATVAGQLGVS